jgi:lysine-N-methylase
MPRALRFMAEFQCIGPECEDSCCANWRIDVDRQHFVKIARVLSRTREGQLELARAFEQAPSNSTDAGRFARMQLVNDTDCPFWDSDKFCSLQRRFGERLLPDVCAHFPRSINLVQQDMELAGQLSCPEVTRKCILHENSCDLVELDEVRFARGGIRQRTYLHSDDPYFARFLEVRETMMSILSRRDYPMRTRLFFLFCFAERTSGFFHRGTKLFDVENWKYERDAMNDPAILDDLHQQIAQAEVPDGLALFVIAQVLAGDVRLRTGGKFRQLVTEVLDSYHAELGTSDVSAVEMWRAYEGRRNARMAASGPRIEMFFENYCKQYLVRDWYVDSATIYQHIQALLVRVAVIRFLLLSHPSENLDELAVAVFYGVSRGVEHHDEFLKLINAGLSDQIPGVLHATALLVV